MKNNKKLFSYIVIIASLFLEILGTYVYINYSELEDFEEITSEVNKLRVHYIDVGQGDSTFIEFPNKKTALIDAGEAEYGNIVANYIKKLGYTKIDYIFATHPHSDHIGGLTYIVDLFDIGSIYMPDVVTDTKCYLNLLQAIERKGKKIYKAVALKNIAIGDNLDLKIIAPINNYEEINDYSIVLKLTYKEKSFLFMADAEYASEMDILNSKYNIDADVLKVGHHGSTSSTNYNFLKKVNPKIAVISVGENNDYGHPKEKILEKLKNQKIKIYRTDLNGNIVITTNGKKMNVRVEYGSYS